MGRGPLGQVQISNQEWGMLEAAVDGGLDQVATFIHFFST